MKILHINASDVGSTGKIVSDICTEAFARGWDCVSLFPKRNRKPKREIKEISVCLPREQGVYRRIHYVLGLHYGFAPISTAKILRVLEKERPDVVHLHSINCAMVNIYKLLDYLKKNRIATVVTNHAEFFYTGSCPHAFDCEKWKTGCGNCPALFAASESRLFDRTHTAWERMRRAFADHPNISVVSVSPWVYGRSTVSPILRELPQRTILNGVDTGVFQPVGTDELREKLKLADSTKIILHVTANFSDLGTDIKGGRYLIELAQQMLEQDVKFVVVGKHAEIKDLPPNMVLLGPVADQKQLGRYYAQADLCVVTSERETFGMTVAEALCCGTPVVGFESGGSESIAIAEYSEFVPFSDVERLASVIREKWLFYKTPERSAKIAEAACRIYSGKTMAGQYCDLYEEMLGK